MNLAHDPEVMKAREDYRQQLEVEDAISKLPRFHYWTAWEVTAAIQAKLERVYGSDLNSDVEASFVVLRRALERAGS